MKRKVFGVGLNKTGSKTLAACLEKLGYNHLAYDERTVRHFLDGDIASLWAEADRHDSGDDWPWPALYRELAGRYPDARFILTIRSSPEVWLSSLVKHAHRLELGDRIDQAFYGYRYPENAPGKYLSIYRRHNDEVKSFLGERCLTVCWETGEGWRELCEFLGEKVPDAPFPFENRAWKPPLDQRIATALHRRFEAIQVARRMRTGRGAPRGVLS